MRNVYKAFGKRPETVVRKLKAGATRDEVKSLGTAAVIDASFEVARGEIFVVMGLSGSGKSTLIRTLNGIQPPTEGTVEIFGQDITTVNAKRLRQIRREKISMVFQHFALLPHRTVGQNAAYALETRGVNRSDREKKAKESLELVGLKGYEYYYPHELSGGMRQRVGLARALAAETELMLMDEAFSALDPLIRKEMQDQLLELQQELGKTIVFITHDLNEAMRLGNRIAVMRDGRIVQNGTTEQILNDPANDYVAQFIQDVDRTRVLTAGDVKEPPVALLGAEQGPRAAHRLMRENQTTALCVVDQAKHLLGVVYETDAAEGVASGQDTLEGLIRPMPTTSSTTVLAELLNAAAEHAAGLAVVDDDGRLLGVIPRVTLLSSLADPSSAALKTIPQEATS
ncbi:glycine betaine/L-proline ABC transporter ATP-binding protein [Nesterenkonia sp. MY13]|uniref:Glycine betaine/L-proline ABC transporter ATP-binding protein n=1 Tax=Nesterenkonia sedimenti TaxID=1463632 RepID=A0A7X8YDR0_9MICC|nr:glycine betaine/L-proline ABC transporter ATP-binding protein [Nesterenkonia sedimenti]